MRCRIGSQRSSRIVWKMWSRGPRSATKSGSSIHNSLQRQQRYIWQSNEDGVSILERMTADTGRCRCSRLRILRICGNSGGKRRRWKNLIQPGNRAGKTPSTTPPLEFTETHRLPPLESGRKTPSTTPLEFTAGTEIRPPPNSMIRHCVVSVEDGRNRRMLI